MAIDIKLVKDCANEAGNIVKTFGASFLTAHEVIKEISLISKDPVVLELIIQYGYDLADLSESLSSSSNEN